MRVAVVRLLLVTLVCGVSVVSGGAVAPPPRPDAPDPDRRSVRPGAPSLHQTSTSSQRTTTTTSRPTTIIDGARTPDQIPDEVAVQFAMTTLLALAGDWTSLAGRAKLATIGLSATDEAILRQELTQGRTTLINAEAARAAPASDGSTPERAERLRQTLSTRDTVTADVYARLQDRLSADGGARLRAYVQEQRRHIRVFRPAPDGADPVVP